MAEHFIAKNCVSNLGRMDEVHLKEACLQWSLLRFVLLERVQQERRCRLDHVLRHKDIDHLWDSIGQCHC